jgi:hypothetical protein
VCIIWSLFCLVFIPAGVTQAQIPGWQGSSGMPADFFIEVTKGNVPGHSVIHRFGHANIGTTFTPVTHSTVYQTPTAAVALEIVSADADDTSAGAGARTVWIQGLDINGDFVTQTVALNGLTAVAIPTSLWRLLDWQVVTTGTYGTTAIGSHQGTLTIRVASAGATWSLLEATPFPSGKSEISWYTVPNGYRAYLFFQSIDVDSTKAADVIFLERPDADIVTAPFSAMYEVAEFVGIAGIGTADNNFPVNGLEAMTDFGYIAKVTSGTADVSVEYEILLIKDGY